MAISRRAFLQGAGTLAAAAAGLSCRKAIPAGELRDYPETVDVCVIGSGFAGTFLALNLAGRGFKTLIVETGGDAAGAEVRTGQEVLNAGEIEYPADTARSLSEGGTSNLWTGVVCRLRPSDFKQQSLFGIGADWPIDYDDLAPYYCKAESALCATGFDEVAGAEPPRTCAYPFSADAGAYRAPELELDGMRAAFFPLANSRRPDSGLAVRLRDKELSEYKALPGATLVSKHHVSRLVTLDGHSIDHAEAHSVDGGGYRIKARVFVVAAGVFESARLLLLSRSQWFPEGLGNAYGQVGRYFVEHPGFASVFSSKALADLHNSTHRTYTFEDLWRRERLGGSAIQVFRNYEWQYEWYAQPELEGRPENKLALDAKRKDYFGNPLGVLTFAHSERDLKTIARSKKCLDLIEAHFADAAARPRRHEFWRSHPAGICRMAANEREGVVDRDNRVFGVENAYVSGACTFTTSGTPNPTLTVVAMTLRLADHLAARVLVR